MTDAGSLLTCDTRAGASDLSGNAGEWVADEVSHSLPRLRFRGPDGSSITPGLFIRTLVSFLRDNAENQELLWSPRSADAAYLSQLASD